MKSAIESVPEGGVILSHELQITKMREMLKHQYVNFTRGGLVHTERVGRSLLMARPANQYILKDVSSFATSELDIRRAAKRVKSANSGTQDCASTPWRIEFVKKQSALFSTLYLIGGNQINDKSKGMLPPTDGKRNQNLPLKPPNKLNRTVRWGSGKLVWLQDAPRILPL